MEGRAGPALAGLGTAHAACPERGRGRCYSGVTAVAVGDDSDRVVAVDDEGTLLVIDGESGEVTGSQAGLIGAPETASSIHLSVDTSRAYLSTPASAELHEIDYKDGARVARTLELPAAPAFAFETGN